MAAYRFPSRTVEDFKAQRNFDQLEADLEALTVPTAKGMLVDVYRQEGTSNSYYSVSFIPQRVRVDAANSIDLAWVYTPPVDVWAEVKGHVGLALQDGSAAWYYLQLKQMVSPTPSVGDGNGYDTVTGHSAAGYHALDVTRTYALDAGVEYTINHDLWAQAASVWKYYQGPSYLWLEGKAYAR